jgi:predicted RNase H-like HicB family nuclease
MAEVPYTIDKDETGAWCASARLGPRGFAFGEGDTEEEAIADLRKGIGLFLEDGALDIHVMTVA